MMWLRGRLAIEKPALKELRRVNKAGGTHGTRSRGDHQPPELTPKPTVPADKLLGLEGQLEIPFDRRIRCRVGGAEEHAHITCEAEMVLVVPP